MTEKLRRELRAEGHRLIAAGHVKLAEAEAIEEPATLPVTRPFDGALIDKKAVARALSLSVITIDRMCREGAPYEMVNARRRFDLEKVRAWCASRPGKTSNARRNEPPADDDIDVTSIMRKAGLRFVGK